MSMANVFVTGGSGFIGSHMCHRLADNYAVVTLLRDVTPIPETPWGEWLNEALKFTTICQGDILDTHKLKRILAEYDIDTVMHFAAQAIVSTAQKDPYGTFQTNVMGTVALLEACRQLDTPMVYIQSTDKIYGERIDAKETDPTVSTGIYETSKAAADLIAQSYAKTYGINVLIGRACNAYGFDMAKRIIPNTIRSCLKGEPPVIYEGEKTQRQYIYVEDLIDAILHLIRKKQTGIFNIATDDILTQEQVVQTICTFFPISPRLVKRNKPLKEIRQQSLNWDKIKATGWTPKNTFREAIQKTIEAYQKWMK